MVAKRVGAFIKISYNNNMNKEEMAYRIKLLNDRAKDCFKEQPRLKLLQDKLLSIGGHVVCFRGYEEDLDKILSRGQEFDGTKAKMKKGQPSRCHSNSAKLWKQKPEKLTIVSGYALSTDPDGLGVWRCHTWVVDNKTQQVIETTEKRTIYFGYSLTEDESHQFNFDNY